MRGRKWWLIILSFMLMKVPMKADPETKLLIFTCGSNSPNNATLFAQILDVALSSVANKVAPSGFATADKEASTETSTDSVYVLAQCRKDLSSADCLACIKFAENQIRNCSGVSAKAYYDGCYLRYESNNFYELYTDDTHKPICDGVDAADSTSFRETAQSLITDLCTATPRINGYFAAQTRQGPSNTTVYGLAFCLQTIQMDSCQSCLSIAQNNIIKCFPGSEGRGIDAGCYLRYDSKPFFPSNATVDLAKFLPTAEKRKKGSAVWIISAVVGGVFLLGLAICLYFFRNQIMRSEQKQEEIEGATELRGPENFDFKALKKATNGFDQANKLGQGGFAEVFKGTLKSGKVVAVKKLILDRSLRLISEFESEVKLISNVHHKNLVRLLGCCRKGQERLLIYEYMPNGSLDRILFGKQRKALSWKERFNIILGTARGLAYLHEEFHVCIIHRDIKPGNILLDENFQAKLADFGLARRLPNDRTHLSTRFAGTPGYTAPEYAGQGKLTEKADTYSFGVVVLEILSGRKSIDLKQPPQMQYLIQWAWKLYEDNNKVIEIVESEEMEGYNEEEVLRVIKIALECIQASSRDRPSMSQVVTKLSSKDEVVTKLSSKDEIGFQKPLQPKFVGAGYETRWESSSSSNQSNAAITDSLTAR